MSLAPLSSARFAVGSVGFLSPTLSAAPASTLEGLRGSAASDLFAWKDQLELSGKKPGTISAGPIQASFEERIFSSLASLKIAVSQYAMHLSHDERHRIFERLDGVINVDDWHEEDPLPQLPSFRNFLKWMIYAKRFDWSSIGVSNRGQILVAWSRPKLALTANFSGDNKVTWTAVVQTDEGEAHTVGSCSLQYFTKQSEFFLGA
jgi:hypothetical protein